MDTNLSGQGTSLDPLPSTPEPVRLVPFRIGLDWLTLSMRGPVSLLEIAHPRPWRGGRGQRYVWIPTNLRTTVFDKVYHLATDRGEKLLTVSGGARSNATGQPPDWMHVQFANRTLYTGEFLELYGQLRAMGFVYLSVARMDIAADGLAGNGGDFMAPIQATWNGGYEYFGKAHWRPRFERKRVTGAELGTRASNKFLRCYDKTKELKQAHAAAKRGYIQAAWAASLGESPEGMGATVNRLELQVKGKEVRRYFPEERGKDFVETLGDHRQLVDMYASMVPKVFDFRYAAKRARDAAPGIVWDFGAVTEGLDVRDREPKSVEMSPHTVKVMVGKLFVLAYVTGDKSWRDKADELAHASGLYDWMVDAMPRWIAQARTMQTSGNAGTLDLFAQLKL